MNPNLTEIAFILDRSGSMSSMLEPAISGFNHLLREQQSAPGEARLTLVLFDDEYLVLVDALPIGEVPELTTATFVPRGSTALLDAVGRTIDSLGERLDAVPEPDRPGNVVVAILTDGEENASSRFTAGQITEMIRHQSETYTWQFLFLGANQDAIATAAGMGIHAHNTANYSHDAGGHDAAARALSSRVRKVRAGYNASEPPPSLQEAYDERRNAGKTPGA